MQKILQHPNFHLDEYFTMAPSRHSNRTSPANQFANIAFPIPNTFVPLRRYAADRKPRKSELQLKAHQNASERAPAGPQSDKMVNWNSFRRGRVPFPVLLVWSFVEYIFFHSSLTSSHAKTAGGGSEKRSPWKWSLFPVHQHLPSTWERFFSPFRALLPALDNYFNYSLENWTKTPGTSDHHFYPQLLTRH